MAADTEKIKQLCTNIDGLRSKINALSKANQFYFQQIPVAFPMVAYKEDEGFEELKSATIKFFQNKLNKLEIQLKIESSK